MDQALWSARILDAQEELCRDFAFPVLQMIDTKAKIAPHLETGRITFYVLQVPKVDAKDPSALSRASRMRS